MEYKLSDDGKRLERYYGETESEFTIPDGVETVDYDAFEECELKKIIVHKNVSDAYAARYCPELESIEVAEDNPYYRSIDGVLFDKDCKTLLVYPAKKSDREYTVPDGVEDIGSAFGSSSLLEEVFLPASLKKIDGDAFEYSSVRFLDLPDIRRFPAAGLGADEDARGRTGGRRVGRQIRE